MSGSETSTATFTYFTSVNNYHELRLWVSRCIASTGSQDINVTVYARPGSGVDANATVNATVYRPLGESDHLTFSSFGDGNYGVSYNFSQNGTYRFEIVSADVNFAPGDLNEYVYVGDFNFDISFVNNGFSVTAGQTGTVQNLVRNSDGNAVTALTGSLDILYPNNSVFVDNGTISETGSGLYYYNFTAPNTNGTYSVTSSFVCGSHTDSNSQGTFVVTGASSGDTGGGGGGGGGGSGGTGSVSKSFAARVVDYNFLEPLDLGEPARLALRVRNDGTNDSSFLVKVTISQAEQQEYYFTQLSPFVKSGSTVYFVLDEEYVPKVGGSHQLHVELFKTDGSELVGELLDSFDVGGLLRYDVAVSCLDSSALSGKETSASITLINFGDFFQDIELSWWLEGADGKKIGQGVLPIALYRNETRNLVRSVLIPPRIPPGEYTFRVQLRYESSTVNAQCALLVENGLEFYERALEFAQLRLSELERIIDLEEKEGRDVSEYKTQVKQIRSLLALMRATIDRGDFNRAESLNEEIKFLLDALSNSLRVPPTSLAVFSELDSEFLFLLGILVILAFLFATMVRRKTEEEQKEASNGRSDSLLSQTKEHSILDDLLGLKK